MCLLNRVILPALMKHIKGVKENDERAFQCVYEIYYKQIFGFVRDRTKSNYIAEEVTQLTFIKLWKQREILQEDVTIQVQLFGMARQVMVDVLRKEAVRFKHEGALAITPFTDCLIAAIESKELLRIIDEDVQTMPRLRRLVFDLSRNRGLSHKEIATLVSITPKAVEYHMGKALKQLKQHLYTIML